MASLSGISPIQAKLGEIVPAVKKDFRAVYDPLLAKADVQLAGILDLGKSSEARQERYALAEAPPSVPRWDYGSSVPRGTTKFRSWLVRNLRWGKALDWESDDAADDQLQMIKTQATGMAGRLGILPQRVVAQIFSGGAADPELLPSSPLSPDGVGIFSATNAEGGHRYGRNGGNILSGASGVASEAALEKDFYAAKAAIRGYLDQAGVRRWPGAYLDEGLIVLASAENEEVFTKTFGRPTQPANVNGITTAVAVESMVKSQVRLVLMSELTGNNWFVGLQGAPYQPIFRQTREAVTVLPTQRGVSDRANDEDILSLYVKARYGFGLAPCDGWMAITQ